MSNQLSQGSQGQNIMFLAKKNKLQGNEERRYPGEKMGAGKPNSRCPPMWRSEQVCQDERLKCKQERRIEITVVYLKGYS